MKAYKDMTREELFAEKEKLEAMYQDYKGQNLALNMSRGKPSASQLDRCKARAGNCIWQLQSECYV